MSYYVTLGGIYISGVTDVSLSSGRDLAGYDGLGNGKFSVPDSENLREWTISCELSAKNTRRLEHWQAAGYVFKAFEVMLKTKDYSRLIVTSPLENISELVYLKQYNQKEEYNGVYDVEITVLEYKPTQIKTTDVPYISRPGKIPIPQTVTITKKNTVYRTKRKLTGAIPKPGEKGFIGPIQNKGFIGPIQNKGDTIFVNPKTGKPVTNPAAVKTGTKYIISTPKKVNSINFNSSATGAGVSAKDQLTGVRDVVVGAGNAIKTGYLDWMRSIENWTKKHG